MIKHPFTIILLFSFASNFSQISDFKNINFANADKISNSLKGNDLNNLPELAYKLTHNLPTDVEKFRAIFTWVGTNIAADYSSFRKNYNNRSALAGDSIKLNEWNKSFSSYVFKKLLKDKITVCTGYSYLIKNLANLANIQCEIIDGYGRIEKEIGHPNHSWNAVFLNNRWYLCDATWSSGTYDLLSKMFEFNFNDGYFLTSPELFATNHFPLNKEWCLSNSNQNFDDFLKSPLVYGAAYNYKIYPSVPSRLTIETEKNTETVFELKYLKNVDTKSINIHIVSGNYDQTFKPNIDISAENLVKIKHSFFDRGTYDVHIRINEEYICTYIVKVKKLKRN